MNPMEEATEWLTLARERELSPGERKELAVWLLESPAHVREYLEIGELWVALQSPDLRPSESQEQLLAAMRHHVNSNVFTLKANKRPPDNLNGEHGAVTAQRNRPLRFWRRPLALAAGVAAIALFIWPQLNGNSNIYKTARGEQRSIVLADGSVIQLNTLSTLVVHLDKQRRHIELTQGEAYFRVAHDQTRPFEVDTLYARVRALGTEFDVYNRAESTRVAVIEGKVTVDSTAVPASGFHLPTTKSQNRDTGTAFPLEAGQQVTVSRTAVPKPTSAKTQNTTAWIQRRIILDNDTIATAVTEFNRYNKSQIRIETAELAALRINGVFNADDPRALVKFLQEVRGINARETADGIVLQP